MRNDFSISTKISRRIKLNLLIKYEKKLLLNHHKFLKNYLQSFKSRLSKSIKFKLIRLHKKKKTKLINEITIYENAEIVKKFKKLTKKYNISTKNNELIKIFEENYMSINLKLD